MYVCITSFLPLVDKYLDIYIYVYTCIQRYAYVPHFPQAGDRWGAKCKLVVFGWFGFGSGRVLGRFRGVNLDQCRYSIRGFVVGLTHSEGPYLGVPLCLFMFKLMHHSARIYKIHTIIYITYYTICIYTYMYRHMMLHSQHMFPRTCSSKVWCIRHLGHNQPYEG